MEKLRSKVTPLGNGSTMNHWENIIKDKNLLPIQNLVTKAGEKKHLLLNKH